MPAVYHAAAAEPDVHAIGIIGGFRNHRRTDEFPVGVSFGRAGGNDMMSTQKPLAALLTLAATCAPAKKETAPMTTTTSGYAPVNGIQLYYEIHGSGEPLVVWHGGLGSIAIYGATIDALAQHRQVIGVDLYGHGHTGFVDGRGLSWEGMADDVGALIAHLGLAQADVMGYSLGAGVERV